MRRIVGIGVVVLSFMFVSQPAWAVRTRFHVAAESQVYGEKAGGMIGRGLLNVLTSFMDVLVNTVNETKAGPAVIGTLKGFATGTGCGALRLGSGVVDVATFWVPGFNGFPVSDSYENCLGETGSTASIEEPEPELVAMDVEPIAEPQETIAQTPRPAEPPTPEKAWKK